ncbi:MAG: hypothetical protein K8T25_12160 [Planctomycetia bacterium]|nr:hypothetical protein [Planctomycetia bacterium]
MPHDAENPYAAPQSSPEPLPVVEESSLSEAQRIRAQYLSHESAVRYFGRLFYFGGFASLILFLTRWEKFEATFPANTYGYFASCVGYVAFGSACTIALIVLGRGLRTLNSRVRVGVSLIAIVVLGLCAWLAIEHPVLALFPELLFAYVLYLMMSPQGVMVFSRKYAEVRRQTPHLIGSAPLVAIAVGAVIIPWMIWTFALAFEPSHWKH